MRRPPPRSTLFPYTTLSDLWTRQQEKQPKSGDGFWLWVANTLEPIARSEEHTSELQSRENLVCRLLLEKKKKQQYGAVFAIARHILSFLRDPDIARSVIRIT